MRTRDREAEDRATFQRLGLRVLDVFPGESALLPLDPLGDRYKVELRDERTGDPIAFTAVVEDAPPVGRRGFESALARGWARAASAMGTSSRSYSSIHTVAERAPLTGPPVRPAWYSDRVLVVIRGRTVTAAVLAALRDFERSTRDARPERMSVRFVVVSNAQIGWGPRDGLSDSPSDTVVIERSAVASKRSARRAPPSLNPFTDAMLLCLKHIENERLAKQSGIESPIPLFGSSGMKGESQRRLDQPGALASRIAARTGLARSVVYRFFELCRVHRFLDVVNDEVRIPAREALFSKWAEHIAPEFSRAIRAGTGDRSLEQWKARVRSRVRLGKPSSPNVIRGAVGAHAAAVRFGVDVIEGAPMLLYVEGSPLDAARILELEVDPPGSAWVQIVAAPFPEATFRFAVPADERSLLPTVDLLQCYMDAKAHPARGSELAAAIQYAYPRLVCE